MKTGVVLELREKQAVLLLAGGDVVRVPAGAGWRVGDVVAIPQQKKRRGRTLALLVTAACLMFAVLGGVWGYTNYYQQTSLISVDVNPSLELGLNHWGTVVSVTAYNNDGDAVLAEVPVVGKNYARAMEELMGSDAMRPYLEANGYVAFSAYSSDREGELLAYLESLARQLNGQYQVQVSCHAVDEGTVQAAHNHHTTGGRMRALRELQELDPTIDIDDYAGAGLGEIQQEIDSHHANGHHGQGGGSGNDSGNSNGNGNGNGGGGAGTETETPLQPEPEAEGEVQPPQAGAESEPGADKEHDRGNHHGGGGHGSPPALPAVAGLPRQKQGVAPFVRQGRQLTPAYSP